MIRFTLLLLLLAGCVRVPDVQPRPEPPEPDVVVPAPPVQPGTRHVLIWRETDSTRIPAGELQQFYGPEVRDWLDKKIGREAYRIWDQHQVMGPKESPEWRKAAERRPKQVPWIVIQNGKTAHEGPLPATAAETLALLEKHLP